MHKRRTKMQAPRTARRQIGIILSGNKPNTKTMANSSIHPGP